MKFKTPCFVRVEDAEKRDELIDWCAMIGYDTHPWSFRMHREVCYVFADGDFAGRSGEYAIGSLTANAIDCGSNIRLFKALAAMNDEIEK